MIRQPYFVILGAMRTGSNLLEKTLEALGDTACFGEAFNPSFIGGPFKEDVLGWTTAARDKNPLEFLAAMRASDPTKIAGFRLFNAHNDDILNHVLTDPACRRIVLRRDPVESYVSLKIARETGQWMLKNPLRRKLTRVLFDPVEFEEYREEIETHYRAIYSKMKKAGSLALHVDYADLLKPRFVARIIKHIGSVGAPPKEDVILRQNPESLTEKVINHAEMFSYLGREPEKPEHNAPVGLQSILFPRNDAFALAAIPGPGFEAAISMMHRMDQRLAGVAALPHGRMLGMASRGELYSTCRSSDEVSGRAVFALVCHPLRRLHRLFETEMFGAARRFSTIRGVLKDRLGYMPTPRMVGGPDCALGVDGHREAFLVFLSLVEEAEKREGSLLMQSEWCSQASHINALIEEVGEIAVFRTENLEDFIEWAGGHLTLNPLRTEDARFAEQRAKNSRLPIADICIPEILTTAFSLHFDDYEAFGYTSDPECF